MRKRAGSAVTIATLAGCLFLLAGCPGRLAEPAVVRPGVEVLITEAPDLLAGGRVGLITNQTGVDSRGVSTVDLLYRAPGVDLVALFGPEHGIRGEVTGGHHVGESRDPRTGLVVHSLYGATRKPTPGMLRGIDTLVFDIQDVGARFYTYISTMGYAMEAAAEAGIAFVVLDRPTPCGAVAVEGPIRQEQHKSFVALHPIPIVHGMTTGELARLLNAEFDIGVDLSVVRMRGWRREMHFEETGLPWVPTSPNIRTPAAAEVYPGMGLVGETGAVWLGIGTPDAFQIAVAPWIDSGEMLAVLRSMPQTGYAYQACRATPGAGRYKGQSCRGVRIVPVPGRPLYPLHNAVNVICALRRLHPEQVAAVFTGERAAAFDLHAGTSRLREALFSSTDPTVVADSWRADVEAFELLRAKYLLY